jgi:steroid delta-isomerase-like uncharacterized protein/uncharacterized protein (TIGR02118 family)
MTTASAEATLREWAAAWSAGDSDRLAAIFTDDCVYEDVTMGVLTHGKAELKTFADGIFGAIPDFAIELAAHFAAGGWAGLEWTMSGTQRGDLPGLPATGKPFTLRGSSILELSSGRIARCTDYWDMTAFLKQIGAAVRMKDIPTAKVIFVLQRRKDLTREQCLAQWGGEQHLAIVSKLPGLTMWVQNHVNSGPADPVCDGIGELWFANDALMHAALNSPEMAAAVEDARRFLDMQHTGMILVEEKAVVGS